MRKLNNIHAIACMAVQFVAPLAAAPEAEIDAPPVVLATYYGALKSGDLDAAKMHTATFRNMPAEFVDQYTRKYSEGAKEGVLKIKPVAGAVKILDDCAVVIFEDGDKARPDYDPAYLIKQDGKWKVFLKLTKWENPNFDLGEEQIRRFRELEVWYRKEKDRLYGR